MILEQQQTNRPLTPLIQLTWQTRLDIVQLWEGATAELVAEEYHISVKSVEEIRRTCPQYLSADLDYLAIRAELSGLAANKDNSEESCVTE